MRICLWLTTALCVLGGCRENAPFTRSPGDQQMFAAVSLRLHPTFTQVKDWTGDKKPDGIEAVVEMQDQFGDPTRSTGRLMFELYSYRTTSPDPKGARIAGPWTASLATREDQLAHWNSAIRGYSFQLADENIEPDRDYVLTVQFDGTHGRLFDQLIIEGKQKQSTGRHVHHSVRATPQSPTR